MSTKTSNNKNCKELCSNLNKKDARNNDFILNFNSKTILQGIILSEILGKPKGQKGMVTRHGYKGTNSR
ncbi:hypothetical protein [Brassicibacter mesophilus]|jgi:hypothetical protein|uniref:hypothetical protein n=1 Tax=Brassicibacter mesophilus TaxID=745119 RepID=UPI003D22D16C